MDLFGWILIVILLIAFVLTIVGMGTEEKLHTVVYCKRCDRVVFVAPKSAAEMNLRQIQDFDSYWEMGYSVGLLPADEVEHQFGCSCKKEATID